MTKVSIHKTVLLNETIDGLNLQDGSIVLDATFGGGGHSLEILKRYPKMKIIALDQDQSVLGQPNDKISLHHSNFRDLDKVLAKEKIEKIKKIDGIIFDLGLSSDQLENSGRGFSFRKEEPLLMTMKENPSPEDLTALDVVNTWSEESLADIIYGYGEERFSRRIARGIAEARKKKAIEKTWDLVKVIEGSVPGIYKRGRLHFATKTFQAIRIAVNDELGALSEGLEKGWDALRPGGRMAVITFHSLEDRIVKRFYKKKAEEGMAQMMNKKPITPSEEELKNNKRARSAKLRILNKTS